MKSRPDYHETTRAIVNMNRDDLDQEKHEWLRWLSHNWKWYFAVNRHSDLNSTQGHHRETEKEQASGNREALTLSSDNWRNGGKDQDGHGMTKSEGFLTQGFAHR